MPIGNLTSQIFANIYLNEFDRFVKHTLKPQGYMRYGDDFIVLEDDPERLNFLREKAMEFLSNKLRLKINLSGNKTIQARHGLKFLGVILWPFGHVLNKRNIRRSVEKLNHANVASYRGLVIQHGSRRKIKEFSWRIHENLLSQLC